MPRMKLDGKDKVFYERIGVEVRRPQSETNLAGEKVERAEPGLPTSRLPIVFGGHYANSIWTHNLKGNRKVRTHGSMKFYPGRQYFIHPVNYVTGKVHLKIFMRKGSGVTLNVWKAANRRFQLPWRAKGEGIQVRNAQKSGQMLFKI